MTGAIQYPLLYLSKMILRGPHGCNREIRVGLHARQGQFRLIWTFSYFANCVQLELDAAGLNLKRGEYDYSPPILNNRDGFAGFSGFEGC